jgi:hypothetical protein
MTDNGNAGNAITPRALAILLRASLREIEFLLIAVLLLVN